jgi:hypothetical protein
MDTYFAEINRVLLASRGYEYDGFLDFLNSIVFISLNFPTRSALPSSSILKIISVVKSMGLNVNCKTSFSMHHIFIGINMGNNKITELQTENYIKNS